MGKDQCKFCRKKGHYEADCFQYKKAQNKLLEKNNRDNGDSGEEHVNVVTYRQTDVIDLCHRLIEHVYANQAQY